MKAFVTVQSGEGAETSRRSTTHTFFNWNEIIYQKANDPC